ncbi:DoxX family membrane protein [Nocardiopsis suaedae]|uniref:DoxX family membrane protein n=1 Tax=Nocardiopsis suaedae TaxID=3018444 RepID=A0ABT4TL36_9ACTN|nr:DoxX family membrane protein [Nocardiopsis suaedae]MDA2805086.1 DoxX family membrane protein [Nocardiopsis suaedae]
MEAQNLHARPSDTHTRRTPGAAPAAGRWVLAVLRLSIGWIFLWAFLDKLFGLGFATPADGAWTAGGSPTYGFMAEAASGPFAGLYGSFAGAVWADWLFMAGLLGIGLAFLLGIGMRIAAAAGALMLVLMWTAVLPPPNNPFMDDHLVMALAMVALSLLNAGDTAGLGGWWSRLSLVRRVPALR